MHILRRDQLPYMRLMTKLLSVLLSASTTLDVLPPPLPPIRVPEPLEELDASEASRRDWQAIGKDVSRAFERATELYRPDNVAR